MWFNGCEANTPFMVHSASIADFISPTVKSRGKNSSHKCTGLEDSAIGKDQLNNHIPDRSILKATSIKISLTGPRQAASHHRFLWGFGPTRWTAGLLQEKCGCAQYLTVSDLMLAPT